MLRLLTHSRPINQTIQLAYDHNKYALDECPAVKRRGPNDSQKLRPKGRMWWKTDEMTLLCLHKVTLYPALENLF